MSWVFVSVFSEKYPTKSLDFVVPHPTEGETADSGASQGEDERKDYSEDAYTTKKDSKPHIIDLWHADAFRIVDFGTEPQLVNKHFYDWLLANASPVN